MEANLKLLKKKRIAHFGNKMSKVNFEVPKLPPDDFVYNIMKDMDLSKNVISYQQLQEFRSKKKQSKNNGQRPSNTSMPDNYCNNPAKKILPKKSFPLMKKCQTSLKYLEKNRCIPKPRAHVGFVPKPPVKPISHAEQSASKFECQNISKVKSKKIQSKAYSKILQTNFKINVLQQKSCESKDFIAQEVEISDHLSSSEDDDAFENFVQEVTQVTDSSDSDSRLIIRRKKSRNKSKQENKRLKISSFSSNAKSRHVSKITSIPLSDSSECEETPEVNRPKKKCVSLKITGGAKSFADSPERFRKSVRKDALESYSSESLSEDASGTFNYDSSDDEPNVETSSVSSVKSMNDKEVTICAVNYDSTDNELCVGNSSSNSFRTLTEKEAAVSTVNVDLQYNSNAKAILNDLPLTRVQSNSVVDGKSASKYELIPCFVKLKRNPALDKRSLTLCSMFPPTSSTGNCFEDDCIVISDDSDTNEVSTMSHSIASHATNKSCESLDLSLNTQKLGKEILDSHTNSSSIQGGNAESDDCIVMFEMPKVGLGNEIMESDSISNSLSSKSLTHIPMSNSTASLSSDVESPNEIKSVTPVIKSLNLNTKTNNDCALVLENLKSDTDVKIAELESGYSLNSGSFCHEDNFETFATPELNVKIVTVVSLVQSSDPPVIEAQDLNGIEIIDLLDDDSKPLEVIEENKSSEDGKVLDVVDAFNTSNQEKAIPCNNTENTVVSCDSTTGYNEQRSCENHPADLKQIYPTINFDHLKAAIDTVYSKSKSSNIVENSSVFNELPHLSNPKSICVLDKETEREVSSEIIILEDEALQKTNSSSFSSENKTSTTICNAIQENKIPVISIPNSKDPLHKSDSGGSAPLKTFLSEPAQNVIQQSSHQDATQLLITIDDTEKEVPFADVNLKLEHINDSNKRCNQFNIQEIPHVKRSHSHIQEVKRAVPESPLDEFDVISTSLVYDLKTENEKVQSLVNLYRKELMKYAQIKSTEINVSAGLKLLHEEQADKVAHLRFALKNLLKHDACFHKTKQEECKIQINTADLKNESVDKVQLNKIKSLNKVEINKNESINKDSNKITSVFKLKNETVKEANKIESIDKEKVNKSNTMNKIKVENITPILPKMGAKTSVNFNSAEKLKEECLKMIRTFKCSHCQKPATATCQGCNEAFFCSPRCGKLSWEKHAPICKRLQK